MSDFIKADRIVCDAEFKFANESRGELEGYASVFGGVDSYGDQVAPGAFKRTLGEMATKGRTVPMYMQHGARMGADPRPVGVWNSATEDAKGLKMAGRLVGLDTETGRYNLALIKEGAMRGLSIGFRTVKADYPKAVEGGPRRVLRDVDLGEVSIVDTPADAVARITGIKSTIKSITDFSDALREMGFSRSEATKLAGGGWPKFASAPEHENANALIERVKAATKSLETKLKGIR